MTDDTILSHAEALAEIKRLQATADVTRIETAKIISRQQVRIAELEAELAMTRGTLAKPTPNDEPATYTHDVPPNAPPHNE